MLEKIDKITKLAVFDLDGTLIGSPLPTDENKAIYKKKTGLDWPSKGWWSRPESLDLDVFDIPLIESVITEYNLKRKESDTLVIMLTGRIKKLSSFVEKILSSYDLSFDAYYYNTGGSTLDYKVQTIEKLLKEHKTISEVHMFDDRLEHIPHFQAWGEKLNGIKFKITVVEEGQN